MTGWRLAWAVGRPELIVALGKVKNYVDTGAFMAVQAAGAAVLDRAEALSRGYVEQFRERRDAMVAALVAEGFETETPRATMYLWIPLPEGLPSVAFQRRALRRSASSRFPARDSGQAPRGSFGSRSRWRRRGWWKRPAARKVLAAV
jgi:LL-diaminopimelate aminotransferase